jgi:GT2 family glycosyltransferase
MTDNGASCKPAVLGLEALTAIPNIQTSSAPPERLRGLPRTVAAVIPCFNRRQDLELLLQDVARQDLRGISLWCVIVDNASTQPLSTVRVPPGLRVEFVRLETNSGGSGGFNAGMAHILSGAGLSGELGPPEFIWWLDSDARVGRRCLRELVKVMIRHPRVGAVGSGMRDLVTGHLWEVGGSINRTHGRVWPAGGGDLDRRFLVRSDYVAACSALVRRIAVERTGLFPDNFIYYDDVDWCIQMRRKTGFRCVGAPRSRAFHPPGNRRFVSWARYYIARNCFSHMDAMRLGNWRRFRRAWLEIPRAVAQAMMGLRELSELHLRGLADARDRRFPRIEPKELNKSITFIPFSRLRETIDAERGAARADGREGSLWIHPILRSAIPGLEDFRRELRRIDYRWPKAARRRWRRRNQYAHVIRDFAGAIGRLLTGPDADVALTPTGWPTAWFRGRCIIQVTTEGVIVRRIRPWRVIGDALSVLVRGLVLCVQIALRGPHVMPLPPAPRWNPARTPAREAAPVAP